MAFKGILRAMGLAAADADEPEIPAFAAPPFGGPSARGGIGAPWEDIIGRIQSTRRSHVIALVHGHQLPREYPWEWYWREFIGPRHMEDFLTALSAVPTTAKLDVILHSFGGGFLAVQQIARAIKAHKGETTVFVPHYAQHLSTLIALAAKNIVLGPNAALSFIEPDDTALSNVIAQKGARNVSDLTVMRLHMEKNWCREARAFVCELEHNSGHAGNCRLALEIVGGKRSPWDPMTPKIARSIGLPISTDVPADVYELIRASRSNPVADYGVKTGPTPAEMQAAAYVPFDRYSPWRPHQALRDAPAPQQPAALQRSADSDGATSASSSWESCNIAARPFIARLEQRRGTRVLCVIHNDMMESDNVDLLTAEDMLTALYALEPNTPLDIILHTPGGLAYQGMQLARALKAHKGKKTVFVPFYAMSAGTIMTLAADEIVMSDHAALGPIDTQIYVPSLGMRFPTRAIMAVPETKPKKKISDDVLEIAIQCQRDAKEHHQNALELMAGTYASGVANKIAHRLNDGDLTHGYPLTYAEAKKLGLKVTNAMPLEAIELVRVFRRDKSGRSVLFCP
jgi:ClpP class serine protease